MVADSGPSSEAVPTSVVPALVADLQRIAATLGTARLDSLAAADAARTHDLLRTVCDQLRAVDARLLAQVEADGRWAASGAARTFPDVGRASGRLLGRDRPTRGRARQGVEQRPARRPGGRDRGQHES